MIPRYDKFTKVQIRVPSKSPIHVESESLIDEDNISRFHRQSSKVRVEIFVKVFSIRKERVSNTKQSNAVTSNE